MAPFLDVRNLAAFYGRAQVLHDLTFSVQQGEVAVLLGANGAGKTTTLRALTGGVRTQGEIEFEGRSVAGYPTEKVARLGIAHIPDGRGTFREFSVEENLRLGAYLRSDSEVEADMDRIFHLFPRLKERLRQQAGTLSGGEQQMLAISRALVMRPRLLLLDEPSFGLAPKITAEIFEILKNINTAEKVSMLIVEQNAKLALGIASQVILLETGRIVISGRSDEVMKDDAVRRSYLGY